MLAASCRWLDRCSRSGDSGESLQGSALTARLAGAGPSLRSGSLWSLRSRRIDLAMLGSAARPLLRKLKLYASRQLQVAWSTASIVLFADGSEL